MPPQSVFPTNVNIYYSCQKLLQINSSCTLQHFNSEAGDSQSIDAYIDSYPQKETRQAAQGEEAGEGQTSGFAR